ncbi:Protein Dicer [Cichlidogyrus casuarinus]|uniref:Protein Dicer n=1 Tax=Cichlidogyrus casuarinus TaxID=1844966 RepID=A0ABD2PRF5_9PLAT
MLEDNIPIAFASFADYYSEKYGSNISQLEQPLIDADYTAKRLNMLIPRHVNPRGVNLAKSCRYAVNENGRLSHKQLLIPELCFLHPIPASVWRKATALPSILFRMHQLSLAERTRGRIAQEIGLGIEELPGNPFISKALLANREPTDPSNLEDQVPVTLFKPWVVQFPSCADEDTFEDTSIQYFPPDDSDDVETEVEQEEEEVNGDLFSLNIGPELAKGWEKLRPSPCAVLQSLTMSSSNDFIHLERLETIGDSFLKYAVTVHQYLNFPTAHEGLLSQLRSQVVCNHHLYEIGRNKNLQEMIFGSKFEPTENWVPPGYFVINDRRIPASVRESIITRLLLQEEEQQKRNDEELKMGSIMAAEFGQDCYSARTQHSVTDKAIADCVEAMIGCYLVERGERSALKIMKWFGIDCMPNGPNMSCSKTGAPWIPLNHALLNLSDARRQAIRVAHRAMRLDQLERRINYSFKVRQPNRSNLNVK